MIRASQWRNNRYLDPRIAFNWLREHDAVDLEHIRRVCLHQGVANTDWSGFIRDNDPHPGRGRALWSAPVYRPLKQAAEQQLSWEEAQRNRQLEKERLADIEWDLNAPK